MNRKIIPLIMCGGGASKTWCRLKGANHLPKIVAGVRFADGIEVITAQQRHAA
jgi:putative transposase